MLVQALQLFWMFYALLQENRPKRNGAPSRAAHCGRPHHPDAVVCPHSPSALQRQPSHRRARIAGDQSIYKHCARLLLQLEQCVVYGGRARAELSADTERLMRECVAAATEAQEFAAKQSVGDGLVIFSGWLHKKGSGSSISKRKWNRRFFQVRPGPSHGLEGPVGGRSATPV